MQIVSLWQNLLHFSYNFRKEKMEKTMKEQKEM